MGPARSGEGGRPDPLPPGEPSGRGAPGDVLGVGGVEEPARGGRGAHDREILRVEAGDVEVPHPGQRPSLAVADRAADVVVQRPLLGRGRGGEIEAADPRVLAREKQVELVAAELGAAGDNPGGDRGEQLLAARLVDEDGVPDGLGDPELFHGVVAGRHAESPDDDRVPGRHDDCRRDRLQCLLVRVVEPLGVCGVAGPGDLVGNRWRFDVAADRQGYRELPGGVWSGGPRRRVHERGRRPRGQRPRSVVDPEKAGRIEGAVGLHLPDEALEAGRLPRFGVLRRDVSALVEEARDDFAADADLPERADGLRGQFRVGADDRRGEIHDPVSRIGPDDGRGGGSAAYQPRGGGLDGVVVADRRDRGEHGDGEQDAGRGPERAPSLAEDGALVGGLGDPGGDVPGEERGSEAEAGEVEQPDDAGDDGQLGGRAGRAGGGKDVASEDVGEEPHGQGVALPCRVAVDDSLGLGGLLRESGACGGGGQEQRQPCPRPAGGAGEPGCRGEEKCPHLHSGSLRISSPGRMRADRSAKHITSPDELSTHGERLCPPPGLDKLSSLAAAAYAPDAWLDGRKSGNSLPSWTGLCAIPPGTASSRRSSHALHACRGTETLSGSVLGCSARPGRFWGVPESR